MGAAIAALFAMVGLPAQEARTPVQQVIAAATLAESKGDLEGAKTTIEKALAGASEGEQEQLRAALKKLAEGGRAKELYREFQREWAGRASDGAVVELAGGKLVRMGGERQDPVQRLIAVLEEGTTDTKGVLEAIRQLKELGALAVPPLVAALPKAGPFGLVNAMQVLEPHSDPRIAPALLERANADPAIAALVIEHSQRMSDVVREALVTGLDETKLHAPARLQLADVMSSAPGTDERRKAIALQLADEPSVQRELGAKVAKWNVSWASEVFTKLRAAKDPVAAASATAQWLLAQQDIGEATALAAIQPLDVRHRWWVARQVTERYSSWAKVALLGLGEGADNDRLPDAWFGKVEWWRGGGDAALKLIDVARNRPATAPCIGDSLERIIDSGWTTPPEAEAVLVSISPYLLVSALPKDDEARALAVWRQFERSERTRFVTEVVNLGLPWHRVVAAHLATAQQWNEVVPKWIERDWSGAPPEAAAALLELARRFPDPAVGRIVVEGQGTRSTSSRPGAWHGALIAACERTPELPAEIVRIFAKSGDDHAWRVLAKRDPRAALRFAQESKSSGNLGALLAEHGDEGDRPLAKRLLAEQREGTPTTGGLDPGLVRYARQFLAGDLDVCEWASARIAYPGGHTTNGMHQPSPLLPLAEQLAAGVRIEQLADFLERLPRLPMNCVDAAMRVLLAQVTSAHVPVLVPALERVFAADPLQDIPVNATLRLIQACAAPACLPALRSALGSPKTARFHSTIARTMLACVGDARRATLLELLAANDAQVVNVALLEKDVAADDDLRIAVNNAVHGKRTEVTSLDALFAQYEPAAATAFSRALVSSPSFVDFGSEAAMSIVRALGAGRDPHEVAVLAQATRHAHPHVRQAATEQLVRMFDAKAAPHLLELLKDDDAGVRQLAKDGLARLAEYLDARTKWDERLNRK